MNEPASSPPGIGGTSEEIDIENYRIPNHPTVFHYVIEGQRIDLDFPVKVIEVLNKLLLITRQTPEVLLGKAVILYDTAVIAEAEGKHLAILTDDGQVDQEITGF